MEVARLLESLEKGDAYERHRAADLLAQAPPTLEVLSALARALADEGFYETPGDYDAPPFHYAVAMAAAQSLQRPEAAGVLELIVETMRRSPRAAYYAARVLAHCGQSEPLLELLRHPDKDVREQAVYALRPMMTNLGVTPQLLRALVEALLDSPVALAAVGELEALLRTEPGLKLEAPDLVAPMVERMRANPGSCTYFRAAAFLASQPEIHRAWLELAMAGSHCAAEQLLREPGRLTGEQVERLAEAPINPELITLLGLLRCSAALPRLVPCLDEDRLREKALRAILAIPGGAGLIRDRLEQLFLQLPDSRQAIVEAHPDPTELARRLVPQVRKLMGGDERTQEEGLQMLTALGPLAESEMGRARALLSSRKMRLRIFALDAVCSLGPDSEAARKGLVAMLQDYDTRGLALKWIGKLGPRVASLRPDLEALLARNPRDRDEIRRVLQGL